MNGRTEEPMNRVSEGRKGFGHVGWRVSVAWKALDNRRTDERINRVTE